MAKRDRLERRIDRVEGRMRKAQSKGRKVCSTRSRGRSGGGGPKSLLR